MAVAIYPRRRRDWLTISALGEFATTDQGTDESSRRGNPSASEHAFAVRTRSFIRVWGSARALAALGLVLWEVLVRVLNVQTWILPPVSLILAELADKPSLFLRHAAVTAQEILIGFAFSITFACVMATAMFWSRLLERSVYPFLIASQTVPVFTLAPMPPDMDRHRDCT